MGSKGELTRQTVLEHAARRASQVGLEGLTIGRLADDLDLSKSGLFAHFRSKEALQVQVIDYAAERFVESVLRPALTAPRGEPRVRALFERWFLWPRAGTNSAGCIFVALAAELDDRPGPARDRLVQAQKDWLEFLANAFRIGIEEGHFSRDADPEQFAHDLYGIMLAHHHASRLLDDPRARERAHRAFEALLAAARAGAPRPPHTQ
ncbi:MAG TPA: TetR/AcrR family transcriptional regulator [Vicinamibacteria bacterium]